MATRRANGKGTIFYNNTLKKWVFTFPLKNGKNKSVSGKSQEEVIRKKDEYIKNLNKDKSKNNIALLDIIKEYVEYKHNNNITNSNSYLTDLDTIKRLERATFIKKSPSNISDEEIKNYLCTITNYSQSIIKKNWSLLNNGFKIAKSRKLINENPLDSLEIIKPKSSKITKKVRGMTIEEQQKFVDTISNLKKEHIYQNIWLIMLYSGMRVGEVLTLTKQDIDFKNRKIIINKTLTRNTVRQVIIGDKTKTYAGQREIRMTAILETLLKNSIKKSKNDEENSLIFHRNNGTVLTGGMINSALKRFCQSNDIIDVKYITNHVLRHTYATRMIEAGVPAHILQHLMGHEDISETLNTYTDIFNKYERKYDKTVEEYYNKNHILLENLNPIDIIKNELYELLEIVKNSHMNNKQKDLLNNNIEKIIQWYEFL